MTHSPVSRVELDALRAEFKSEVAILKYRLIADMITMAFITTGVLFSAAVWIFA